VASTFAFFVLCGLRVDFAACDPTSSRPARRQPEGEDLPLGLEILFAGTVLARHDLTGVTVNVNRVAQAA